MYHLSSLLAFAALVAAQGADPSIATPAAIVQCQPAQISFTASKTPAYISIIPGGQAGAAAIQDFGPQSSSPLTWVANITGGTQITFQLRDGAGALAYSAPITIQSSSDNSCLNGGASSSAAGSASSSASQASTSSAASISSASSSSVAESTSSVAASASSAASSAASTATAPATTSRASVSAASSSSRSATATSAATSATTTPNSARSNMQVGFAGLIGLAAAVVLA